MITDYKGKEEAKKTRAAINENPITSIMNQISGLGSGIIKSALIASGVPESEMNARLKEATELRFAGNMELTYAERRYLANAQQYAGLAVTGTSYHSSIPSGQKGIMEELQKQLFMGLYQKIV